ncbi:hypothetical protein RIF29_23698 [Crotalaria pallida]|uniref:RING-type E3 ubiquitin transferase n=1 Tax=Crotalaria pallida TaxID=3830 RepID=A0AAN9IA36_CROPI
MFEPTHFPTLSPQQPPPPPPPFTIHNKLWDPSIGVIALALVGIVLFYVSFSFYLSRCSYSYDPSCISQRRRGIHPELLHTFPTLFFSTIDHLRLSKGALECAVCLTEFTDDDTLRLLPQCNHVFHPPCIDQWLSTHVTCPLCRADLTQDFHQVSILTPTQMNANETDIELDGSLRSRGGGEEGGGGGEGEIIMEGCPCTREGRLKGEEGKGVKGEVSKWKLLERANSTGHSVMECRGECMERHTLRLPEEVRKYILLNHGVLLQRSASCNNVVMPRRGLMCWSDSEGSSGKSRNTFGIGTKL